MSHYIGICFLSLISYDVPLQAAFIVGVATLTGVDVTDVTITGLAAGEGGEGVAVSYMVFAANMGDATSKLTTAMADGSFLTTLKEAGLDSLTSLVELSGPGSGTDAPDFSPVVTGVASSPPPPSPSPAMSSI